MQQQGQYQFSYSKPNYEEQKHQTKEHELLQKIHQFHFHSQQQSLLNLDCFVQLNSPVPQQCSTVMDREQE